MRALVLALALLTSCATLDGPELAAAAVDGAVGGVAYAVSEHALDAALEPSPAPDAGTPAR